MVQAVCLDSNGETLNALTQWDYNKSITIECEDYTFSSTNNIHFCNENSDKALVVSGTISSNTITASVPNSLLREPYAIYAYIYRTETSNDNTTGQTVAFVRIPVIKRKQPYDYTYSDDAEIVSITKKIQEVDELIAKINNLNIDDRITAIENQENTWNAKATPSDISTAVNNHNTSTTAHTDIRTLINNLTTRLNTLADSDDTTLDQLSEIVAYIKNNKDLIDGITTNKVNVSDIIDNLTSSDTNKPLSAKQGKALKDLIDALDNNKVSKETGKGLSTNDYTTAEKTKLSNIAENAEVNVQSDWNVTDTTSDAYILNKPTKVSQFTNDSGYATETWVNTNKQDKLVSGTNIKTVNGYNILGDGNVDIVSGKIDDVKVNGTTVVTDKIANITVESAVNTSTNPIQSTAVKTALDNLIVTKQASETSDTKLDLNVDDSKEYTFAEESEVNDLENRVSALEALGLSVVDGIINITYTE